MATTPKSTVEDIAKQDFLTIRKSADGTIANVVAPNGLQIGLTDERFQNPLVSKGIIFAEAGVSGSLTRLTDGSSYLRAGGGVDILSASNGAITISSSGMNIGALSNQLTDSDLDKNDLVAVADATNSNTVKKIRLEDIAEWMAAGTTFGLSLIHI